VGRIGTAAAVRAKLLAVLFLEEHQDWVLISTLALAAALYIAASVYTELATLRPFLFFVYADGQPPPVCGLCVLFGVSMV